MFGEGLVNLLIHVVIDVPVLGSVRPCPHDYLYGTVGQIAQCNEILGRTLYSGIGLYQAGQHLARFVVTVAVRNAERPFDAARTGFGHVVHDAGRHAAVGNDDGLVVRSYQHRIEEIDGLHGTLDTLRHDIVARAERFEQQDKHPARKVLERSAQCHADGKTGRSEYRQERRRPYAEHSHDYHDEEYPDHYPQDTPDKGIERGVQPAFLEYAVQESVGLSDEPAPHDIDKYRSDQLSSELDGLVQQVVPAHLENAVKPVLEFAEHFAVLGNIHIRFGEL